jgi:hypothetical protein
VKRMTSCRSMNAILRVSMSFAEFGRELKETANGKEADFDLRSPLI